MRSRNRETGELKYFIANAPPQTDLQTLWRVAFSRWKVEHTFRRVKSAIGCAPFEGRTYTGLQRHMILCPLLLLFVAEQTNRLRGKNPQLTLEQVARALHTRCRRWQQRLCPRPELEHVAAILRYPQARNLAAKRSRLRSFQMQR